jgi:hypothetical protein
MVSFVAIGAGMWNYAFAQSSIQGYPRYRLHWLAKGAVFFSAIATVFSGIYSLTILDVLPDCCRFVATMTVTPTATFTPSTTPSLTHTSVPLSDTPTSTATSTSTMTATSTSTFTPTLTPTIEPSVLRGLDKNCFDPTWWKVNYYSGEDQLVDSRNCWDLTAWGIIPDEGGVDFIVKDTNLGVNIIRRLRTKLEGDVEIKFSVKIDQFTTNRNFDGMLMLGVGSSVTIQDSGFYVKYVVAGEDNKIYRETAPGLESYYEPRSTYTLGETQNIIIRVIGNQAKILADGVVLRTTSLQPHEYSVFWICYTLPANNGSLIADVTDVRFEDH